MSENCNSRHLSWLIKSCFPNSNHHPSALLPQPTTTTTTTAISSLPDDLLLEILSRVPHSSFSSISLVSRRWSRLLHSAAFHRLRHLHNRLHHAVFALSLTPSSLHFTTHRFTLDSPWTNTTAYFSHAPPLFSHAPPLLQESFSHAPQLSPAYFSHARVVSLGPKIYIISRTAMLRYDAWDSSFVPKPGILNPRKKFAVAAVSGKIYIACGACKTNAVEEYNPHTETWKVVASAPRKRYGCIGASVGGVFYVIGGLKIGSCTSRAVGGAEANVYPSSMDLYDVAAREWLRSRTIPGGGCVVAACGAGGHLYVLASHTVELSFWRFNGCRISEGCKEWCRIKAPPLPAQVRLDSSVRFSCIGMGEKVVLIQVVGCIDDLLRRGGRNRRGLKDGLVLIFDTATEEWSREADIPEVITRAACVCVEC